MNKLVKENTMKNVLKFSIIPILLIVFFIFSYPYFLLEAQETDAGGGQKVEQLTVEQSDEVKQQEIEELFSPGDKKLDDVLSQSVQLVNVVGERPNAKSGPTPVKVSIYVFDISKINDAEQTFDVDFRVVVRWVDPRLAEKTDKIRQFSVGSIWYPLLSVSNMRDFKQTGRGKILVSPEGHCLYVERFLAEMTVPLNLKNFPKDIHKLYLKLRSYYGPEDIQLIIDENLTGWESKLSIPDWEVRDGQAKVNTHYSNLQKRDQAQLELSFKIDRFLGFYFWKIIIPLTLIVFMSWGVFWVDPRRLEAQLGLSATAVLTLVAFQFAIANLVPKVSYLTRMDKFTMMSSVLIFLALIEAIITAYFAKKEWISQAVIIDRFSRVLFPVTFALIIYFSFIK